MAHSRENFTFIVFNIKIALVLSYLRCIQKKNPGTTARGFNTANTAHQQTWLLGGFV
jgi:hypothetical protein